MRFTQLKSRSFGSRHMGIFVLGFAVVGLILLVKSFAVTSVNSFEPETGNKSLNASVVDDTSASGGLAVRFKQLNACTGTNVTPGQNIQSVLDAQPTGATICFAAGTYRFATFIQPKSGQKLIGLPGAILSGAIQLSFTASGSDFVAAGQLPSTPRLYGDCDPATPLCNYEEDVFWNDTVMSRVTSRAALAPGKFYADYANNKIYVRDNPANVKVEQAVSRWIIYAGSSANVTVRGFVIEKAASPAQDGAIHNRTTGFNSATSSGWVVEYNEVRLNHGVGIMVDASHVQHNFVHHNGEQGMGGQSGTGGVAEYNEVSYNNAAGYLIGWEGGAFKFAVSNNVTIRGNYVHDNNGPGPWCDINCHNAVFEDNVVINNKGGGIFYEISYDGIIRNNYVINNVSPPNRDGSFYNQAEIIVSAGPNTQVYGNTVKGSNGIGLLQQCRDGLAAGCPYDDPVDPEGPKQLSNTYIHDNIIIARDNNGILAGGVADWSAGGTINWFTGKNNRFVNNKYYNNDMANARWSWNNGTRTQAEWQAAGQDTGGVFSTTLPAITLPAHPAVGPSAQ